MKRQHEKQHTIDTIFVLTLLCVFTISALIVVYIGSQVYSSTVNTMEVQFNNHTAMNYIIEKVHMNNHINDIEVIQKEGINILCLHENYNDQTYTTYIYTYQNQLKELLISDKDDFSLESGETLMEIDRVSFVIEKQLLSITLTHKQKTQQSYISILGGQIYETTS